jgi:hypothetical protein
MKQTLLLLLVLAVFVAGCESKYKDPDPVAMGYDYYPLEKGQYRVYQVQDVRYVNDDTYTQRFQLRERVDSSFIDQTGQEVFKIIRSIRPNAQAAWLDDSVMTVAKKSNMVVLTKDNTRYIKLVFPVKNGLEFVGDLYNTRTVTEGAVRKIRNFKEVYTIESVGEAFEHENKTYQNTATVVQGLLFTEKFDDNRFEVYADGIGLAYRLFRRLDYKSCDSCGDDLIIESGHEREEVLIDHGKL